MRPLAALYGVLALTASGSLLAGSDVDAQQAQQLVKSFATTLQGELQTAMKAGGPIKAVEVCRERAPAIAAELSAESGWDVGRTSAKIRNPDNAPDAWEAQVLQQFEDRLLAGESAESLGYAETVEAPEGTRYRFMKAIPTGEVCLACHGTDIAEPLAETLDKAYPDDRARGYSLGDIRGAFTLSKPM